MTTTSCSALTKKNNAIYIPRTERKCCIRVDRLCTRIFFAIESHLMLSCARVMHCTFLVSIFLFSKIDHSTLCFHAFPVTIEDFYIAVFNIFFSYCFIHTSQNVLFFRRESTTSPGRLAFLLKMMHTIWTCTKEMTAYIVSASTSLKLHLILL